VFGGTDTRFTKPTGKGPRGLPPAGIFGRLYALVRLLKLIWTQLRCFVLAYETICKYGPTLFRRELRQLVGNQIFSDPNHLLHKSAQPFLLASLRKSV
jgi:hypothetical protein